MTRTFSKAFWLPAIAVIGITLAAGTVKSQEKVPATPPPGEATGKPDETQAKYDKFTELLSGSRLVGTFTIKGNENEKPRVEEYEIAEVKKLPRGDYWQFKARIKYGDNDYTVPLSLEVKWAGDTPMIQLTDFSILGQGPFSARVMFYDGMYAGTWSHGEVGGHMFGRVEKMDNAADKAEGGTESDGQPSTEKKDKDGGAGQ